MSGEPKTHTLEEAIQLLGPDEVLLVGYCGWEGMQYSVVEESSVKFLTHSYSKWEDALTDRLDRKVVARDEAAEAKPIGWDDVADEDMMAALVKAQTEANVLKRAVREWVAADAAYSEWMVLPVREDWTSGEAKARKERLEVAEAELRRLAGGENEK